MYEFQWIYLPGFQWNLVYRSLVCKNKLQIQLDAKSKMTPKPNDDQIDIQIQKDVNPNDTE